MGAGWGIKFNNSSRTTRYATILSLLLFPNIYEAFSYSNFNKTWTNLLPIRKLERLGRQRWGWNIIGHGWICWNNRILKYSKKKYIFLIFVELCNGVFFEEGDSQVGYLYAPGINLRCFIKIYTGVQQFYTVQQKYIRSWRTVLSDRRRFVNHFRSVQVFVFGRLKCNLENSPGAIKKALASKSSPSGSVCGWTHGKPWIDYSFHFLVFLSTRFICIILTDGPVHITIYWAQ